MAKKLFLPHFQILFKPQPANDRVLHIITPRRIRRAVDRNRIKRIVRAFFWEKRALLPKGTVICRADPSAVKSKNEELFQELNQIL